MRDSSYLTCMEPGGVQYVGQAVSFRQVLFGGERKGGPSSRQTRGTRAGVEHAAGNGRYDRMLNKNCLSPLFTIRKARAWYF